jgi:hypothetical protein
MLAQLHMYVRSNFLHNVHYYMHAIVFTLKLEYNWFIYAEQECSRRSFIYVYYRYA